jgi:5S rRNA maturation endonuclease (ribonuclease M5)
MVDTERYERLLEVFEDLSEVNRHTPVLVEGRRDAEALRELGLRGEIEVYNKGLSMHEFCESVLEKHDRIVLLMDWDSTGEKLQDRLSRELAGHWEEHESFRRLLRVLCQKEIKDMEGVPCLIRRLGLNAIARPEG